MMRVCFDVGGQTFTIRRDYIETGPPSRLTSLCNEVDTGKDQRVIIDRPVDLFQAILALYQTGELHMPMTSCPGVFLKELEFWGIQLEMLQTCCMYRLQLFLDEQQTLNKFREHEMKGEGVSMLASCMPGLERIRAKIWAIIDFREYSIWSKMYFVLVLIMVLLSIFAIAYSTEPSCMRTMTNCERLEFMEATNMDGYYTVLPILRDYCDVIEVPEPPQVQKATPFYQTQAEFQQNSSTPLALSSTSYPDPDDGHHINDDGQSSEEDDYDYTYITVPFYDDVESNTTEPEYDIESNGTHTKFKNLKPPMLRHRKPIRIPNMKIPIFAIVLLEMITLAFFTVEFVVRLVTCPNILRYFWSIINVAEALALVGAYLHIIIVSNNKQEKYINNWKDVFDYMQMLRSFRLFRIVKNVRASRVLVHSFRINLKDLCILMFYLLVGVCTFSSCIYLLEARATVASIPKGWYWALITMTTVGYGDIVPVTPWGRFVACLCSIAGVLLFALTVPIFATHFLTLYQYAGLEKTFSANKISKRLSERSNNREKNHMNSHVEEYVQMEEYETPSKLKG